MNDTVALRVQLFKHMGQVAIDDALLSRSSINLALGHDGVSVRLEKKFIKKRGRPSLQLMLKD